MGTEFQFYKLKRVLEMDGGDDPSSLSLEICFVLSLAWDSLTVFLLSFTLVITQCASYFKLTSFFKLVKVIVIPDR